jgi:hypothetical protein
VTGAFEVHEGTPPRSVQPCGNTGSFSAVIFRLETAMNMSFVLRNALLVVACTMAVSGMAHAEDTWLKGSTDEKLDTLAKLQPGLGTVMIEYSTRITNMYYAAKGGNWGFAEYQLQEAKEIQEVGETTRPKRAQALKNFESKYLDPLEKTLQARDFKSFDAAFSETVDGCNNCHKDAHYGFIKYELPSAALTPASLNKK